MLNWDPNEGYWNPNEGSNKPPYPRIMFEKHEFQDILTSLYDLRERIEDELIKELYSSRNDAIVYSRIDHLQARIDRLSPIIDKFIKFSLSFYKLRS